LASALDKLAELPGRRIFQYRDQNGVLHLVGTRQVNGFLREIADTKISLKDFRTLLASASVLEFLCATKPAASEQQRRKQVMQAIRRAADDLANTPAICRKSYVHSAIVEAFEDGVLERFANALKGSRSTQSRVQVLTKVLNKV
jgi:DNA topoisomerase-1